MKKNIFLIPIDGSLFGTLGLGFEYHTNRLFYNGTPQHVYITSDDEIEDKDFVYWQNGDHKGISQVIEHRRPKTMVLKKIICTNNENLITLGVHSIPEIFFKLYCANPVDYIDITVYQYLEGVNMDNTDEVLYSLEYKFNFPKLETGCPFDEPLNYSFKDKECTCKIGEPYNNLCCKVHGNLGKCTCERPDDNTCDYCDEQQSIQILAEAKLNAKKQATIEEAIKLKYNENLIGFEMYRDGFIAGAKWKGRYTEQDMIKLIQFIVSEEDMDDFSSISPETSKYYLDRFLETIN